MAGTAIRGNAHVGRNRRRNLCKFPGGFAKRWNFPSRLGWRTSWLMRRKRGCRSIFFRRTSTRRTSSSWKMRASRVIPSFSDIATAVRRQMSIASGNSGRAWWMASLPLGAACPNRPLFTNRYQGQYASGRALPDSRRGDWVYVDQHGFWGATLFFVKRQRPTALVCMADDAAIGREVISLLTRRIAGELHPSPSSRFSRPSWQSVNPAAKSLTPDAFNRGPGGLP